MDKFQQAEAGVRSARASAPADASECDGAAGPALAGLKTGARSPAGGSDAIRATATITALRARSPSTPRPYGPCSRAVPGVDARRGVELAHARGRVLAAGFVTMLVAATGAAGNVPSALSGFGAAPVMTGAPIPDGADAVVPVEEAEPQAFLRPGHTVRAPAERLTGRFVRRAGEAVVADELVLVAGTALTPLGLGVLAALGLERIRVRPMLRAGILTTADEVVEPGQELEPTQIHNANAPLLRALLESMGMQTVVVRHVVDDDAALRQLLRQEAPGAAGAIRGPPARTSG